MGRPKQWVEKCISPGIYEVEISSWKYFSAYILNEMLDYRGYIWRGHLCHDWKLEPTLDRILRKNNKPLNNLSIRNKHLENFKYAARGRRGINPPILKNDNDWWALGQHNGLATPLLDWSASPFVAAYFAYADECIEQGNRRAIYALTTYEISKKCREILKNHKGESRADIVEFIKPLSDENHRLVNQGGMFTRSPDGEDVESWIKRHFDSKEIDIYILIKLILPESDRELALKTLNRMNINHLTLFPDLYGASKYCNTDLKIKSY
ncbi:FRG domain protein [compost metagenome]|nr:FRG domain-containing protein [Paenibacillus timonensis]MUG88237.1 FRG domain-containing protein [Paenibacillus timonensis]